MEWREVYSIKNDRLTNQRMIEAIRVLEHIKYYIGNKKRPNNWVVFMYTISFTL